MISIYIDVVKRFYYTEYIIFYIILSISIYIDTVKNFYYIEYRAQRWQCWGPGSWRCRHPLAAMPSHDGDFTFTGINILPR